MASDWVLGWDRGKGRVDAGYIIVQGTWDEWMAWWVEVGLALGVMERGGSRCCGPTVSQVLCHERHQQCPSVAVRQWLHAQDF